MFSGRGGTCRAGRVLATPRRPRVGIGAVGLRSVLASSRRLSVGRVGEERCEANCRDLFDDVAPTRATLHCECYRAALCSSADLVFQPVPEPRPVRLPEASSPDLPGIDVQDVVGDLSPVQVESTYHAHEGPPCARLGVETTQWLPVRVARRSSHIECSGTVPHGSDSAE